MGGTPGRASSSAASEYTCSRRASRSEEHTSELQSRLHLVCRLLLEKKKNSKFAHIQTPLTDGISLRPPIYLPKSRSCHSLSSRTVCTSTISLSLCIVHHMLTCHIAL